MQQGAQIEITYRTESWPSDGFENSDSVGLANGPFCVLLMTGVLWLGGTDVYSLVDGICVGPIPSDAGKDAW